MLYDFARLSIIGRRRIQRRGINEERSMYRESAMSAIVTTSAGTRKVDRVAKDARVPSTISNFKQWLDDDAIKSSMLC